MRTFARQLLCILAVAAIVLTIDAIVLRTHAHPQPIEHAVPRKSDEKAKWLHASKGQESFLLPYDRRRKGDLRALVFS